MVELSGAKLNVQIVKMRHTVRKAKLALNQKVKKRINILLKKKASDDQKVMNERKVGRLSEELKAAKMQKKDEVTKFALVNTKTLAELNIDTDTPLEKRALYKLVTMPVLLKAVEEFRKEHGNWRREVPFLLQRLGHQYRNKGKGNQLKSEAVKKHLETESESVRELEPLSDDSDLEKNFEKKLAQRTRKRKKAEKIAAKKKQIEEPKQSGERNLEKSSSEKARTAEVQRIDIEKLLAEGTSKIVIPGSAAVLSNPAKDVEVQQAELHARKVPSSSFFVGGMEDVSHVDRTKTDITAKKRKFMSEDIVGAERKQILTRQPPVGQQRTEPAAVLKGEKASARKNLAASHEKLHPSWEAKRKLKAAEKSNLKAKKIVFDD